MKRCGALGNILFVYLPFALSFIHRATSNDVAYFLNRALSRSLCLSLSLSLSLSLTLFSGAYDHYRYPQEYIRPESYSSYNPYTPYGDRSGAYAAYGGYSRGYDMHTAAYGGRSESVLSRFLPSLFLGCNKCPNIGNS